ncbi:hypothetical protein BH23BAC1_BH23BAC1_37630 [soil metagenome]
MIGNGISSITGEIKKPFDPPLIESPDRIPRKEAYEKEWAEATLGNIKLHEGRQTLTLKAIEIPKGEVAEINGIILKKYSKKI